MEFLVNVIKFDIVIKIIGMVIISIILVFLDCIGYFLDIKLCCLEFIGKDKEVNIDGWFWKRRVIMRN